MPELAVQIVRFVDSDQPGWVECAFVDAAGRQHSIIEKIPVITREDLNADSKYPRSGTVRCEVLKRYQNDKGQDLVCVTTNWPFSVETTEGLSEFTVSAGLISALDD